MALKVLSAAYLTANSGAKDSAKRGLHRSAFSCSKVPSSFAVLGANRHSNNRRYGEGPIF